MLKRKPFVPQEPESMSEAVERFTAAGYDHELHADAQGLHDSTTGRHLLPEELIVDEVVRIEGMSDPGDESIVIAVHDVYGTLRATFASAFGASAAEADADVLRRLTAPRRR